MSRKEDVTQTSEELGAGLMQLIQAYKDLEKIKTTEEPEVITCIRPSYKYAHPNIIKHQAQAFKPT
jgi:hypothetical protein